MSTKEFNKLNRGELLEVIYRMQLREKDLSERVEQWRHKAEQRYEKLELAGNIAEASISIHEVFETAQRSADDYVATVCARVDHKEAQVDQLLEQIRQIASDIQSFLGELDGEEMGLDSYRQDITSILQRIDALHPQSDTVDPRGDGL